MTFSNAYGALLLVFNGRFECVTVQINITSEHRQLMFQCLFEGNGFGGGHTVDEKQLRFLQRHHTNSVGSRVSGRTF